MEGWVVSKGMLERLWTFSLFKLRHTPFYAC